jgi:hypothetical protein
MSISRIDVLKDLYYNSNTGVFKRRTKTLRLKIGDKVGCIGNHGYLVISLNGKTYLAHRLAWLINKGEPLPKIIDHINGDKLDNRICNLRSVTKSENNWNQKRHSINNMSKELGVSFNKRSGKYTSGITKNYIYYHLGTFSTLKEASDAYKNAKKVLHVINEEF